MPDGSVQSSKVCDSFSPSQTHNTHNTTHNTQHTTHNTQHNTNTQHKHKQTQTHNTQHKHPTHKHTKFRMGHLVERLKIFVEEKCDIPYNQLVFHFSLFSCYHIFTFSYFRIFSRQTTGFVFEWEDDGGSADFRRFSCHENRSSCQNSSQGLLLLLCFCILC